MASFGQHLRREREHRSITLEEISGATKIARHHLEALEADDFAHLPRDVFTTGYVRAYAQFIGLDPEPLVEAYVRAQRSTLPEGSADDSRVARALVASVVRATSGLEGRTGARPRFGGKVPRLVSVALLLGAAAAGWLYFRGGQPDGATSVRHAAEQPPPEPQGDARRPEVAAPGAAVGGGPRVSIPEFGVGTRVVERQLRDRRERFAEGTRVWFWTRVVGGVSGARVRHVWFREGREVESTELSLGGPHWRTYSHKDLSPGSAGGWAVEARDSAGRVLARTEFACVKDPGR